LDQQGHRFVPAEAVYAVFEIKPTINKAHLEYAAGKAASVRKLKRTSIEIRHAGGVFPAKPLFSIIAGIVATGLSWKSGFGPTFLRIHQSLKGNRTIDCGLAVSGYHFDCYELGTQPRVFSGNGSFAFFLFRFLQKLQTLGTVPAVDWTRYGKILS
jgi:hypothetical protein